MVYKKTLYKSRNSEKRGNTRLNLVQPRKKYEKFASTEGMRVCACRKMQQSKKSNSTNFIFPRVIHFVLYILYLLGTQYEQIPCWNPPRFILQVFLRIRLERMSIDRVKVFLFRIRLFYIL